MAGNFFHDPAARGKLPVTIFKSAAESYGYILAGSNNSHNGPMEDGMHASYAMREDVFSKFNIDTNRIYLCGFSGGSRLVSGIAATENSIDGIIGCGAGLPSRNTNIQFANPDIIYAGVVGKTDMNYIEMHELHEILNNNNITNRFFEFDGEHEWPDSLTAIKVIRWLRLQEEKRKIIPPDSNFIITDIEARENKLNLDVSENIFEDVMDELLYLKNDLNGLYPATVLDKKINDLLNNAAYQKYTARTEEIYNEETQERLELVNAVMYRIPGNYTADSSKIKNDAWFKIESKNYRKK